jgi:glucose/arabinose dehydrogenase
MAVAAAGAISIASFGQTPSVLSGVAAYGDWRSDAPGVRRKITPADMPPPYETASASRYPTVVSRPADAWPKAPPGFVVKLLAGGLDNPRLIRVSPSGDIFVAESGPGRIRFLRVTDGAKTP